jgi:DHA1 family tetracycline resistance protein-like MFS transporter
MDIVGFGIIIPLLPFYIPGYNVANLKQTLEVTLLFSIYSICQFIGAPVLGLMSDRFGRRPVLALSQVGSSIGYLLLGIATQPWFHWTPGTMLTLVYVSRMLDGFTGGNISTAQAYISDITTPKTRAKGMGMLGAAFGIGFVLGPMIGGMLGSVRLHGSDFVALPAYAAMAMSAGAALATWKYLPETRSKKAPVDAEVWLHPGRFAPILRKPVLVQLLVISFFSMACFVMMESTATLFFNDVFGWNKFQISLYFCYLGVVIILVQGGMIGRLTKRFGEWPLAIAGPALVAVGMIGYTVAGISRASGAIHYMPAHFTFANIMTALGSVLTLLSLLGGGAVNATGRSLQQPTISALMSQHSNRDEQGAVFGLFHGLMSLARVAGPLIAAPAFLFMHHTGQFLTAGIVTLLMAVWTAGLRRRHGTPPHAAEQEGFEVIPTAGEPHGVTMEP